MPVRLTICLRLLLAALAISFVAARAAEDEGVLVDFDFEGELATGPYTVTVFENSRGSVALSEAFHHGGARSVEIRDVAGDGDFAEMMGFFPRTSEGVVTVRFALLVAERDERMNVAFAGPAHFTMKPDGMAFWLQARDGHFLHVSEGEARALAPIEPFVWYAFEVAYDVEAGRYDLTIAREGDDEPLVSLRDQPNAVGEAGSALDRFSFIGDVPWEDGSNTRFYVDDLLVTADRAVDQGPFVAPGRRMLFVDIWDHYARAMARSPGCPPVLGLADFGVDEIDRRALASAGMLQTVQDAIDGCGPAEHPAPESLDDRLRGLVEAVLIWRGGCAAASGGGSREAVGRFREAAGLAPTATIYGMSEVLALGAAGRWTESDEKLAVIYPDWRDDPRYPSISATLGLAREDLASAEEWLSLARDVEPPRGRDVVLLRLWSGELGLPLLDDLRSAYPDEWRGHLETVLTVEQRYHVLLWQDRFAEARRWAERVAARYAMLELDASRWIERSGDAAFRAGDHGAALELYESVLASPGRRTAALLKLSDVHFSLGHADLERAYRERVYGSLSPEDEGLPLLAPGLERTGPESCPTYR